ncbi:MAG: nucleotidyltransferase family protein [Desulfuromonadales bacterium]
MTSKDITDFLKAHKQEMVERYGVVRIGLFGSYARGDAKTGSDIDIAVELEKPDLFYLIGIKQSIEDEFGGRVDVVRLRDNMNGLLKKRILQDVIYV